MKENSKLSTPLVSVVMPCYNVEDYLDVAMESVLGQSLENIEIVCVNDGSKDSTLSILQEYSAKDSRVLIVDGPNGGYGKAMNKGMSAASGEYIAILEPDDFIDKEMLKTLYDAAEQWGADFVKSDYYRFTTGEDGKMIAEPEQISSKPEYYGHPMNPHENHDLFNMQMMNWTGIYKRDFVEAHGIKHHESPGASYQDNGFWFQVFCWADTIGVVNRPFYYYRQDNANSSINQDNKVFCMPDEYAWIRDFLRSNPELEKEYLSMFHYKKLHNYNFAFSLLAPQYRMPFAERYSREYKEAMENNELDKALYWPGEWEQALALAAGPKQYCDLIEKQNALEEARKSGTIGLLKYHMKYDGLAETSKIVVRKIAKR